MRHLVVKENIAENQRGRRGKWRKRIDIEFERTGLGKRPRFAIEAKRLYRSDSVSEYLGQDGLGCFLAGEYAAGQTEAGMLGYVQAHEPVDWATRIESTLHGQRERFQLCVDTGWTATRLVPALADTYESHHERDVPAAPISVFHILLRFH